MTNGNDGNNGIEDGDLTEAPTAAESQPEGEANEAPEALESGTSGLPVESHTEDTRSMDNVPEESREESASDELEKAVLALALALDQPEPSVEMLMDAGDAWWRVAVKTGTMESYVNTAEMYDRVLSLEPERRMLQRRIGYCRLLQAQRETGKRQLDLLDEAVEQLGNAAVFEGDQDAGVLTDWGYAILQRAGLIVDGKNEDYALAVSAFCDALKAGAAVDSDAAWLLQRALRLRANMLPPNEALACRTEVKEVIANALQKGGNMTQRPLWQASAIQAELETVQDERLTGVARRVRLKEIQNRYRKLIRQEAPVPIILSWVELLGAEADGLVGPACKKKYVEAEQALMLCAPAEEEQSEMELQMAISRIARRRSRLEPVSMRLGLLSVAEKALQPYLESDNVNELKMEAAHVTLELASLLDRPVSQQRYRHVISMLEPLLEIPAMEAEALRCYLTALLALDRSEDGYDEPDWTACLERLFALAPEAGETWLIAAKVAQSNDDYEKASACCASAWRLGASRSMLMPVWQQVIDDWASSSAVDGRLPMALTVAKKQLRMAKQVRHELRAR
ncbi:MAG: hypothetical protein LBV45_03145 [Xanthomonadaceae bacterium]|nr:hypothetical protein [Xanthomonadaceae bacterium]